MLLVELVGIEFSARQIDCSCVTSAGQPSRQRKPAGLLIYLVDWLDVEIRIACIVSILSAIAREHSGERKSFIHSFIWLMRAVARAVEAIINL